MKLLLIIAACFLTGTYLFGILMPLRFITTIWTDVRKHGQLRHHPCLWCCHHYHHYFQPLAHHHLWHHLLLNPTDSSRVLHNIGLDGSEVEVKSYAESNEDATSHTEHVCLTEGDYEFVIYGGLCCYYGEGHYNVKLWMEMWLQKDLSRWSNVLGVRSDKFFNSICASSIY